ncbi:extracellular solute-binding protein [Haploplasma modicum]|uniref:extracellular solute-binding protein n=1 Tax=Haploplasma modicum TaxID=2150 RepID=UPI00214C5191|nr:extracellular solute-binding protein [Haploplasma modicum]MCR1808788.1 extracellular solute-binding protein [Haploplasma modicum]
MKKIKKILSESKKRIKQFMTIKVLLYSISFFLFIFLVLSFFPKTSNVDYVSSLEYNSDYQKTTNLISGNTTYSNMLLDYKEKKIPFINENSNIRTSEFNGHVVTNIDDEYGEIVSSYSNKDSKVYLLDEKNNLKIKFKDIKSGVYYISIDYYELNKNIDNNQISLMVKRNGDSEFRVPFHESNTMVLKSDWSYLTKDFTEDRYGNEIQSGAEKNFKWRNQALFDYNGLHVGYYGFHLSEDDEILISSRNNSLLIGEVSFVKYNELESYENYLKKHNNKKLSQELIQVSARDMEGRSEASIRLRNEQNPTNLYYDTQFLKLNTVFADSWQNGGQTISYKINVNETAMYKLAFKYRQYSLGEMPTFRRISIDNEVPFDLFEGYAFPHTTSFVNRKIVDENGDDVLIFLEEGEHIISLEAVSYPYRTAIEKIREIMSEIQNLSLRVKRYTSGGNDPLRDWDIEKHFPEAKDKMYQWADDLDMLHESLKKLSGVKKPAEISNLTQSSKRLRSIAKKINKLPSKMALFSDGDSSVNQLLGATMQRLMISGMELERVIFYGNSKLKNPAANIFVKSFEEVKRLILSYTNNPYSVSKKNKNDLTVWVNHPRQYIEIMQALIDEKFDGERRVTLSQMPDQNKLILANASGDAPDIAIGVDHWIPYEFAIRKASLDLRQFKGYADLVSNFMPGSLMPYIFEDGVFGLPETQNFWVTYYRKDILESVGVDHIPQTWDEIKALLPILQSYDLNYFIPLSQFVGLKPFVATLPFIYQFGGNLYTEDGMQTDLNSSESIEGVRTMTELFTLYNMQKYVASFYNNFRYGTMPIGISDLSTYILLDTVALELDGLWEIDLHPGQYSHDKDEILRYAPAGGQSSMIMSTTKYKNESWDFLSWWMSTEIQSEFAFRLQNTYGKAYFWSSANVNAFKEISMDKKHKDVILKQWEYAAEAPRIPGLYMIERELSNAWTKIVFDDANPRQALDDAVRVSNREILYKMAEFGYVENGIPVKDFLVPTIDNIEYWLREAER